MSIDRRNVNLSSKVAREIAEMGTLLNDRACALGFVPPVGLGNRLIGTSVACNGGHHGKVIFLDDLLHHLHGLQVSQHISVALISIAIRWATGGGLPDGAHYFGLADMLGDLECLLHLRELTSRDWFFDKHSDTRERLQDLKLDVTPCLCATPIHRGTSDDDGTRPLARGHVRDEIIEIFVDTGVLVSGNHEGLAFHFEDGAGSVDGGVNESYHFQPGTQFAIKT